MRFLVDAQLPPTLARMIAEAGHTAEHVADIGMLDAADSPIWGYALQHGAVIVTKDEDFPHRSGQSTTAPPIVWLRIGNASRRALLEWFEPLLPRIEAQLEQGEKLIEVR
jgi:predicted nuclease of predicted toxin-antitoxin system